MKICLKVRSRGKVGLILAAYLSRDWRRLKIAERGDGIASTVGSFLRLSKKLKAKF